MVSGVVEKVAHMC